MPEIPSWILLEKEVTQIDYSSDKVVKLVQPSIAFFSNGFNLPLFKFEKFRKCKLYVKMAQSIPVIMRFVLCRWES